MSPQRFILLLCGGHFKGFNNFQWKEKDWRWNRSDHDRHLENYSINYSGVSQYTQTEQFVLTIPRTQKYIFVTVYTCIWNWSKSGGG